MPIAYRAQILDPAEPADRTVLDSLRADPGIEFLEYLSPRNGRPYPLDAAPNDLIHWETRLVGFDADASARSLRRFRSAFVSAGVVKLPGAEAGFRKSLIVRDPDGHAVQIVDNRTD